MENIFSDLEHVVRLRHFIEKIHEDGPKIANINAFNHYVCTHFEEIFRRGFLKLIWGFIHEHYKWEFEGGIMQSHPIDNLVESEFPPQSIYEFRILLTKYRVLWNNIIVTQEIAEDIVNMRRCLVYLTVSSFEDSLRDYIPMMILWRDCFLKQQLLSHYIYICETDDRGTLAIPEMDALAPATQRKRSHSSSNDTLFGPYEDEDISFINIHNIPKMISNLFEYVIQPFLRNSNSYIESTKLQSAYCDDILLPGEKYFYASRPGFRFIIPNNLLDIIQDIYTTSTTTRVTDSVSKVRKELFEISIKNGRLFNFVLFHIFNSYCESSSDMSFSSLCCITESMIYETPDYMYRSYQSPRILEFKNEYFVCFQTFVCICSTASEALIIWCLLIKFYCKWRYNAYSIAETYDMGFIKDSGVLE